MDANIYTKLGVGPNLVFLHGWGRDRHTWDGVIEQLKHECMCWTLDLPGFGQNPRPKTTWNPRDYAQWVRQFMAENNIDTATIVGHSFGGRVAIEFAASTWHSEPRTWNFILYATPGFREPISRFTSIAQALAKGLKHARIPLKKIPVVSSLKKRLQSTDDQNAALMHDIFRATIEYDLGPAMAKIDAPVLLLWGEHDREVPLVIARAMQEAISSSVLKVIPSGSHFAHIGNQALFCGMIREFVKHHGP